jgi:hypothetical protein
MPDPQPPPPASQPQIVYLDPHAARPISQYSPEGEIRMMGDFAAGLARSRSIPKLMVWTLVVIVLLPILVALAALIAP